MFDKKFGFIVDKIIELITINNLYVEKFLDLIAHSGKIFVSNFFMIHNKIIYMIDFEKTTKGLDKLSG